VVVTGERRQHLPRVALEQTAHDSGILEGAVINPTPVAAWDGRAEPDADWPPRPSVQPVVDEDDDPLVEQRRGVELHTPTHKALL